MTTPNLDAQASPSPMSDERLAEIKSVIAARPKPGVRIRIWEDADMLALIARLESAERDRDGLRKAIADFCDGIEHGIDPRCTDRS